MASLQLIDDVALDRRIFLPDDQTWLIGRGRECDVRLRDSSISREHARIVVESGLYYLEDLDSRNGTFLNEAPVHAAVPLYDGDVLRISRFAFTFRSDGDGLAETFDDESTMIAPQAGEPADGFSTEEFVARMSVAETSIAEPAPDGAETGIDRQLRVILQLLHDVKSTHDLDVSLPLILGAACELFPQCENAQIAVVRSDGRIVTRAVKRGADQAAAVFEVIDRADSIPASVVRSGEFVSLLGSDARRHAMFGDDVQCLVCVPIVSTGGCVRGALSLEGRTSPTSACEAQRPLLEGVASVVAGAIEASDALANQRELEKDRRQLRMARVIQQRMLPSEPPEIAGYSVAHAYQPAHGVGGDYFDYYPLHDNRWVLIIADVCGKGLSASLSAAQLAAEFRHCMELSRSVKAALRRLNQFFFATEVLVTLQFAVLDPRGHTLSIANAGHPAPLRRRGKTGSVTRVAAQRSGLPLGIDADEQYHLTNIRIKPNDSLLFYTDGATDAFNRQGELFGWKLLQAALADGAGGAAEQIELIRDRLNAHQLGREPTDDTCLVCLQRTAE